MEDYNSSQFSWRKITAAIIAAAAIFAGVLTINFSRAQIFSQPIYPTAYDPLNALNPAAKCGAYWGPAMNPPLPIGWYKWNGVSWEYISAANCPAIFNPPPSPTPAPVPPTINPPPVVTYPPPPINPQPTNPQPTMPIATNPAFADPAIRCGAYWGPSMNPPLPNGWYKWNGTGWSVMNSSITCI